LPDGGRSEIYCNRNVPKLIDLIIIIIIIIIRGYSTAAGRQRGRRTAPRGGRNIHGIIIDKSIMIQTAA